MLILRHNQSGFTLVELLIGIVIVAILVSAGAPSFMIWIQNSQIRTAAESISSGLQLARAEAVRRNANIQFALTGTANVDSTWTVGCATPVADLNLDGVADCPAVIQSRAGSEGTANAMVSANNADVTFNGLGRASNATNNALTINITNPTGGTCQVGNGPMRCLDVRVATGGQVRMCNPAISSSNPQGC